MTDISICIPTFERPDLIEKTLSCLVDQVKKSQKRFEIVVTDNSPDRQTELVIQKFRDVLNINYHRHLENVGPYWNFLFATGLATGKYCLYLADDDQLVLEKVEEICEFLDLNRSANVVYAPWVCLSPSGASEQFYRQADKIVSIKKGDYLNLLLHLLKTTALPEIFIFRRQHIHLLEQEFQIGQYFLVQAASFVKQSEVIFWSEPFYLQTIHNPTDGRGLQQGHDETINLWDKIRGGLEIILAQAELPAENQVRVDFLTAINSFVGIRIAVSIRLRLKLGFGSMLDAYLLALRARALGVDLVLPLASFKKFASIEFIFSNIQNLDLFDGVYCDLDLTLEEIKYLNQKVKSAKLTLVSSDVGNLLYIGGKKNLLINGKKLSFNDILTQLP